MYVIIHFFALFTLVKAILMTSAFSFNIATPLTPTRRTLLDLIYINLSLPFHFQLESFTVTVCNLISIWLIYSLWTNLYVNDHLKRCRRSRREVVVGGSSFLFPLDWPRIYCRLRLIWTTSGRPGAQFGSRFRLLHLRRPVFFRVEDACSTVPRARVCLLALFPHRAHKFNSAKPTRCCFFLFFFFSYIFMLGRN